MPQTDLPRRVIRIVLTGGIVSGKTCMLEALRLPLMQAKIPAAFVPECATELIRSGYTPDRHGSAAFQHAVFRRQIHNENRAFRKCLPAAKETGLPVLLLCDRGLGDCAAYLPEDTFATICRSMDYSRRRLWARYQGVLFLDTSAVLPDLPFDIAAGNENRLEGSRREAMDLNERTWQAWEGHPSVVRIPAETEFAAKQTHVLQALAELIAPWYGKAVLPVPQSTAGIWENG